MWLKWRVEEAVVDTPVCETPSGDAKNGWFLRQPTTLTTKTFFVLFLSPIFFVKIIISALEKRCAQEVVLANGKRERSKGQWPR
jgi:hypothetical protein